MHPQTRMFRKSGFEATINTDLKDCNVFIP